MPEINVAAQQLGEVLQAQGTNRQRIRQILTTAAVELGDQFTSGTIELAIRGLNPALQRSIRQVAQRLIPPPPLPPGIRPEDINAARIFHGGAAPDQVDRTWANFTNALRSRVLDVNQHTNGLVARWLREAGLEDGRQGVTAAQRGAALARAGWHDNFFSAMELAAVFQYSQGLNENDRAQFQQAFIQEFTNQVREKFPGQEQYLLMQFTRFMNNTNWDSNDRTTQGFRTFMNALMTGQAEASLTQEQRARLQANPGTSIVLATYDIPGERGNFGAACLVGSYRADGTFQTIVIPHRPGPPQNRWRFDFGQAQQPAQPNQQQQPVPGFGNLPQLIQQWLQWLQQMPPLQPQPGAGGAQPPPAVGGGGQPPAQRLPNMNPGGGRFANLNGVNFRYRVGNDPNAPLVNPGQANNGITINPDGTYTVNAGVPNGTRVTIVLPNGQNLTTTVEANISNENSLRPGTTQRNPELNGTPFRVRINNGQLLQPDQNNPIGQGIIVRPNGDIVVPPGTPIGTRITIVTDSGQTVTRVIEPDLATTLGDDQFNHASTFRVPPGMKFSIARRSAADGEFRELRAGESVNLGNGLRMWRDNAGNVGFTPTGDAASTQEFDIRTDGGQRITVGVDGTPPPALPALPSININMNDPLSARTGQIPLPDGVQIVGIRLEGGAETSVGGGNPIENMARVDNGNGEELGVSVDGHFDANSFAIPINSTYILRTSDGREIRVNIAP